MKKIIASALFLFSIFTSHVLPATPAIPSQAVEQELKAEGSVSVAATSVDAEFTKLFVLGFLETFAFYYSCDLRVGWNKQDAFWHCLAGGLMIACASRLGSLPKLTMQHWTKREVLKHVGLFFGFQIVARLICMMKLLSGCFGMEREEFKKKFVNRYDMVMYFLLIAMPLLKRRGLKTNRLTEENVNNLLAAESF